MYYDCPLLYDIIFIGLVYGTSVFINLFTYLIFVQLALFLLDIVLYCENIRNICMKLVCIIGTKQFSHILTVNLSGHQVSTHVLYAK